MKKKLLFMIVLSLLILTTVGCDHRHKHTVIIDPAIPAACIETGLTEGSHCADCGVILAEQQVVSVVGHDYEEKLTFDDNGTAVHALCFCKICGDETEKQFCVDLAVEFNDMDKTCSIKGIGECTHSEVNIPPAISGCTVTSIDYGAFQGCSSITDIDIPDSVTKIVDYAFRGCESLVNIEIPDGITCVDSGVFSGCTSLASIKIPDSVTSIDEHAFTNCESLVSIEIPRGVTAVHGFTFSGCKSLTSITIPDSVTRIGHDAFRGCESLMNVKIPDGLTELGRGAFGGCSRLTSIEIPDGVRSVEPEMFWGCESLVNIEIPDGVTQIGDNAFADCPSLSSVTIPCNVTGIGERAFSECVGMNKVYFAGDVEAWCNVTFDGSESNPLSGGAELYINGELLVDLVIPDTVLCVQPLSFFGCESIKTVRIHNSVTEFRYGAFENCSGIEAVYYEGDLASWSEILFGPKSNPLSCGADLYINGVLLGEAEIVPVSNPMHASFIRESAFCGCRSLKFVTVSNGADTIDENAFENCAGLESVVIPDSVWLIGVGAFKGCSALRSVYYCGTLEDWNSISISSRELTSAAIYYYSETKPGGDGSYWRYVDGKPTPW